MISMFDCAGHSALTQVASWVGGVSLSVVFAGQVLSLAFSIALSVAMGLDREPTLPTVHAYFYASGGAIMVAGCALAGFAGSYALGYMFASREHKAAIALARQAGARDEEATEAEAVAGAAAGAEGSADAAAGGAAAAASRGKRRPPSEPYLEFGRGGASRGRGRGSGSGGGGGGGALEDDDDDDIASIVANVSSSRHFTPPSLPPPPVKHDSNYVPVQPEQRREMQRFLDLDEEERARGGSSDSGGGSRSDVRVRRSAEAEAEAEAALIAPFLMVLRRTWMLQAAMFVLWMAGLAVESSFSLVNPSSHFLVQYLLFAHLFGQVVGRQFVLPGLLSTAPRPLLFGVLLTVLPLWCLAFAYVASGGETVSDAGAIAFVWFFSACGAYFSSSVALATAMRFEGDLRMGAIAMLQLSFCVGGFVGCLWAVLLRSTT
jgi:hypothetical protein